LKTDDAAARDRVLQKAGRAHIIDEAIDGGQNVVLALGHDDRLRNAEQAVRQQSRSGR
jgi:hypothetical protein